ncbi:hypothetical protein INT48_007064 [Thamnidium elegans]|uniref:Major facilitator superfamily (MFS) profile domain-containing protein n=1 Tax=Thamnidium elegans TaxID=101142 RepID=A0A8H7VVB8_9FUNG|nr:hypothetical protein INT48_007064 [Thamnidium elegans]
MSQKITKPFPSRQLAVVCVCRFAMVRDFKIAPEQSIGYYVGLITSCFALTQVLTGLVGTIISILLFGLSKSFAWALFSRSLCGLLNGNISVLKSMVSELTNDLLPHQRAQAFSLLPLMYGLGSIIGPMLGGFLSHPVSNYPNIFGHLGAITDFLVEYPYFLPCFISAFICLMGLIFGMIFLEETHKAVKYERVHQDEEVLPISDRQADLENYSTFTTNSTTGAVKIQHSPTPTLHDRNAPPTLKDALTPTVVAICITYGFFALQAVYMDASSRDNGGLGFSPNEIGSALAFSGVITLCSQIFILPVLTKKYGLLRLFQIVLFILVFVYLVQGVIPTLYYVPDLNGDVDTKFWVWVGLLIVLTFKTVCHTISFTGCTILVNNACPRDESLGAVNGFSSCCASGMRAIGPAMCGVIWSASLSSTWIPYSIRVNIAFVVLAGIGLFTYYLSTKLNADDYETAHSREEVVSTQDPSSSTSS